MWRINNLSTRPPHSSHFRQGSPSPINNSLPLYPKGNLPHPVQVPSTPVTLDTIDTPVTVGDSKMIRRSASFREQTRNCAVHNQHELMA